MKSQPVIQTLKNALWGAGAVMMMVSAASAADLLVDIRGGRGNEGTIRLTLFDQDNFMNYDRVLRRSITSIRRGGARLHIRDLPPGKYSFTILHDANANAVADRNFFGIPTEGVAVSNNARGFMGPPDGHDAEFLIARETVKQMITMVYY